MQDVKVGNPGPDEVLIKHEAIGLNFRDTYHRSGSYSVPGVNFQRLLDVMVQALQKLLAVA